MSKPTTKGVARRDRALARRLRAQFAQRPVLRSADRDEKPVDRVFNPPAYSEFVESVDMRLMEAGHFGAVFSRIP